MGITRPAQIAQNNKLAKSLQYLKKDVRDKIVFWADEHHICKSILSFLMGVAKYA